MLMSFWPYIFLVAFTLIFFHKLFFSSSIFSTPGDIAYFNYPLKNFLSESLKNYQLPLWSNQIGTGFPILADSPIGAFYLPNLILFYLFPTPIAFNLHYILIFLTSTIGTYLLCRYYKLSKLASLYAALAYGFSGFFIARIIHTSFIQVASLLPFIFLTIEKYLKHLNFKYLLIFSLLVAQMIFIGYAQGLFYSIFSLYIYLGIRLYQNKQNNINRIKTLLLVSLSILTGVILASAQVLPTLEMLNLSTRSSGLGADELFKNSGSLKILALFFNPFIFGNISKGTLNGSGLGFYWENIAYSGLLTPVLALIALIFVKQKVNKKIVLIFGFIALASLLLAIGKFGPAYIIFDIPPFSYFRIPARFLFLTSFSISILSAYFISSLEKNRLTKILSLIIVIFLSVDIFKNWYTFNSYSKAKTYLAQTESSQFLKSDLKDNTRISTLWPFLQKPIPVKDWNKDASNYLSDFNSLGPDINMVYSIPTSDFYTSFSTRRLDLIRQLFGLNITLENDNSATIKNPGVNLLKLQSVKFILSSFKLNNSDLDEVKIIQNQNTDYQIYIYKIKNTLARFRMVNNYEIASSLNELESKLQETSFDPNNSVILEKEPPKIENRYKYATIENIVEKNNNVSLKIQSDGQGFLTISDTYYPGWIAKVNNKKTEVYAANANSKAIIVNSGENIVNLSYKPLSLQIGLLISLFMHILVIFLILLPQKFFKDLSVAFRRKLSASS